MRSSLDIFYLFLSSLSRAFYTFMQVSYEFAMIANRDDCRFEYFMRSILLGPRQPAFMAYTTSGIDKKKD